MRVPLPDTVGVMELDAETLGLTVTVQVGVGDTGAVTVADVVGAALIEAVLVPAASTPPPRHPKTAMIAIAYQCPFPQADNAASTRRRGRQVLVASRAGFLDRCKAPVRPPPPMVVHASQSSIGWTELCAFVRQTWSPEGRGNVPVVDQGQAVATVARWVDLGRWTQNWPQAPIYPFCCRKLMYLHSLVHIICVNT